MPRGIPKDPNHPKNLKRTAASAPTADAPKRRGRPPGSKNAKKAEVAEASTTPSSVGKVKKSEGKQHAPLGNVAQAVAYSPDLFQIRDNINALAHAASATGPNSVITKAIEEQVTRLNALTSKLFDSKGTDADNDVPVGSVSTPSPVAAQQNSTPPLPAPPAFMPPPFPTPST